MACLLILARPAGTDRYTTEEQLQRAATIASSPAAFLALCQDFIKTASAQPVVIEPDATDDNLPDGICDPSDEQRLKKALFYGNRCEWGKAYQAFGLHRPNAQTAAAWWYSRRSSSSPRSARRRGRKQQRTNPVWSPSMSRRRRSTTQFANASGAAGADRPTSPTRPSAQHRFHAPGCQGHMRNFTNAFAAGISYTATSSASPET